MTFANNLKGQLLDFVDCYKRYFWRTIGTTLTFTVICFVSIVLLVRFSNFDTYSSNKQVSIVSYFFYRYSTLDTYSIVDLSKAVFVFFVALFSIGLTRLVNEETENKEIPFISLIRKINIKDVIYLMLVLIVSAIIDYGFSKIGSYSTTEIDNGSVSKYFRSVFFQFRIYVPLILFSFTVHSLTINENGKIKLSKILFLYFSLWLFNEFAYEVFLWVRTHLFGLILLPVESPEKMYLFESFLGIPLIAFYFLGYHSAMTATLKQMEHNAIDSQ